MRRVAITGIGCLSPAGADRASLEAALARREPLGVPQTVRTVRGRARQIRLAHLARIDREAFIPQRRLRRMGDLSQVWVIACLLARADAGLGAAEGDGPYPPDRRGTYLGSGFGCTWTTWDYLLEMMRDGAGVANPFLFSESVANAPAGHSAIELGTRGASVTFTCGDASAAVAMAFAARAIREGRVDMAYCGGVEMFSPPLLRLLATIGTSSFFGEGCVCFVLESMESARARDARVHAEVAGDASVSDPAAAPTDWSRDAATFAGAMRRAARAAGGGTRRLFLHACGAPAADAAERRAAEEFFPEAEREETTSIVGCLSAAGGFSLAAAALSLSSADPDGERAGLTLVNASSWGGTVVTLALRPR